MALDGALPKPPPAADWLLVLVLHIQAPTAEPTANPTSLAPTPSPTVNPLDPLRSRMSDIEERLEAAEIRLEGRVTALESDLASALGKLDAATSAVSLLQNQMAAVMAKLAPDGPDGKLLVPKREVDPVDACDPSECTPSIETGDGVGGVPFTIDACCAPLLIKDTWCAVEPCALLQQLDALQSKLGL